MDDYDGSHVLEQLAERGLLDAFYDAVDGDQFERAQELMERAGLDDASIQITLQKMRETDTLSHEP